MRSPTRETAQTTPRRRLPRGIPPPSHNGSGPLRASNRLARIGPPALPPRCPRYRPTQARRPSAARRPSTLAGTTCDPIPPSWADVLQTPTLLGHHGLVHGARSLLLR